MTKRIKKLEIKGGSNKLELRQTRQTPFLVWKAIDFFSEKKGCDRLNRDQWEGHVDDPLLYYIRLVCFNPLSVKWKKVKKKRRKSPEDLGFIFFVVVKKDSNTLESFHHDFIKVFLGWWLHFLTQCDDMILKTIYFSISGLIRISINVVIIYIQ